MLFSDHIVQFFLQSLFWRGGGGGVGERTMYPCRISVVAVHVYLCLFFILCVFVVCFFWGGLFVFCLFLLFVFWGGFWGVMGLFGLDFLGLFSLFYCGFFLFVWVFVYECVWVCCWFYLFV